MKILLKNATILTMDNKNSIINNDILIENNKISKIGKLNDNTVDKTIDLTGKYLLPGFIQTHIHLCQTLFRGHADDLELLDWLMKKIWPFEGAHNYDSLYWSSMLGISELISGGTTTILDMGTVHHTDAIFQALVDSGLRAYSGKVMMDYNEGVPQTLQEKTDDSLKQSFDLFEKWHNSANGRIKYAYAPRFAVSCTEDLLTEVSKIANKYELIVHTHASENQGEVALIQQRTNRRNIQYLYDLGLANERFNVAHCIWLSDEEFKILEETHSNVLHCPSSNLKLGSGIADINRMKKNNISVSIGADGAPCNNNLDALQEARLASLLQKGIHHDSTLLPAAETLRMLTIDGAKALHLENEIGSVEIGKKADLIVINPQSAATYPSYKVDPFSRILYSANRNDIETVIIDGQILYENFKFTKLNKNEILKNVDIELEKLLKRV